MTDKPRIAVTVITVTTEQGDFVLLGAQDPRWRIDDDGKFEGISAVDDKGELAKLPLQPGFVGGEINSQRPGFNETAVQAALREVREEAGRGMAAAVGKAGLTHIFTSVPNNEKEQPETAYFHSHLNMRLDDLKAAMKAGDDNVALMLVRPAQITRREGRGYVLNGAPEYLVWRAYEPVNPGRGEISAKKKEILAKYDAQGAKDPLVGIDSDSFKRAPYMYGPPGCSRGLRLNDHEIQSKKGGHVSNGAIFEQLVVPRLAQKPERTADSAARHL